MAKVERIVLMKVPEYDDRMVQGLIELRAFHGVKGPMRKYIANLIDRTVSETQPQYALMDDEDLVIWPQYIADPTMDLGSHRSEEAAISRCQQHHDSTYGQNVE
jgi:hypothetical protein